MSVEAVDAETVRVEEEENKFDFYVSSPKRPLYCTAFEAVELIDEGSLVICLSDGSQWFLSGENTKNIFHTISKNWKVGDDVRVESQEKKFAMKNVDQDSDAYVVKLSKKCGDVSKAFFVLTVDPSSYAVRLSDDSLWTTGWMGSFKTQKWREGDRIIMNAGRFNGDSPDYTLYNVEAGSRVWMTHITA